MKEQFETKEVVIKKLVTEGLQIRVEMNEDCIEDYADKYRTWDETSDKKKLPPITVYYDSLGDEYYLADGFHRVIAAKRAGWEKIPANVHEGTYDEALRFALSANAENGLHRTNADKRNALDVAWQNRKKLFGGQKVVAGQLATICGVSERLAGYFLADKKNCNLQSLQNSKHYDATTTTSEHFEIRDPRVRDLISNHKDRFGVDIPDNILNAFTSREPQVVMRTLGEVRKKLDGYRDTEDHAFVHGIEYALRDLDATIRAIRNGQPFCVCRMCRGKGCGSCSDFGFQTKLQYKRVPREYKAEQQ